MTDIVHYNRRFGFGDIVIYYFVKAVTAHIDLHNGKK